MNFEEKIKQIQRESAKKFAALNAQRNAAQNTKTNEEVNDEEEKVLVRKTQGQLTLQQKMEKLKVASAIVSSTFGKVEEIRGRIQAKMNAKLAEATYYEDEKEDLTPTIEELAQEFPGLNEGTLQNMCSDIENFMAGFTDAENYHIGAISKVYDQITTKFSREKCELISYAGRQETSHSQMGRNLTYGEIGFESFTRAFQWIRREWKDKDPDCWHNAFNVPGGTYIDLGHGMGKGILGAALTHQFECCRGVEILENLHNESIGLKSEYENYVAEISPEAYLSKFGWSKESAPRFQVESGDLNEHEWGDADFIYVNSACFDDQMMQLVYQKSLRCIKGSWLLTIGRQIPEDQDQVSNEESLLNWQRHLCIILKCSWGLSSIFLYRKNTQPQSSFEEQSTNYETATEL